MGRNKEGKADIESEWSGRREALTSTTLQIEN